VYPLFPENGITSNGYVITIESSGDLVFNITDFQGGKEEILDVHYNFNSDTITGIEHIGYTGTQIFKDQVGVQTYYDNTTSEHQGDAQIIFLKALEVGQKAELEGRLQGFKDDYKEGYSAWFYVSFWKGQDEGYCVKAEAKIFRSNIEAETFAYSTQSQAYNFRAARANLFLGEDGGQDPNTAYFNGMGHGVILSTSFNGWELSLYVGEGVLQIAVQSGPMNEPKWDPDLEEYVFIEDRYYRANWLFSYNLTILNNNF
jgi:hypothetical protein